MRARSYPVYPMNFPRGCRNLSLLLCLIPAREPGHSPRTPARNSQPATRANDFSLRLWEMRMRPAIREGLPAVRILWTTVPACASSRCELPVLKAYFQLLARETHADPTHRHRNYARKLISGLFDTRHAVGFRPAGTSQGEFPIVKSRFTVPILLSFRFSAGLIGLAIFRLVCFSFWGFSSIDVVINGSPPFRGGTIEFHFFF